MVDTVRTLSALQTLLGDNTSRGISPQDLRDLLLSALPVVHDVRAHGGGIDKSASVNTGAINEAIEAAIDGAGGIVLLPEVGTYSIDDELGIALALGVTIRGAGRIATKIRQTTTNKAIFNFTTDGAAYNTISDLDLIWSTPQNSSQSNSYGIAVSVPGETTQGVFGLEVNRVRMTYGYRGFGIRKASGYCTLWDTHLDQLVIKDMSGSAIYWKNPTAVGQPENTVGKIYIQNPTVTPNAAAVVLQAVDLVGKSIGIEDWTNDGFLIESAKEKFIVDDIHFERHHLTATNARAFRISSTGLVKVASLEFGVTLNHSGDTYIFVPGGGVVLLDDLVTIVTNTAGALSLFASGSGDFVGPYRWYKVSGTVGDRPLWDSGADALFTDRRL